MTRFELHADKFRNMQLRQVEHMKRHLEAREALQSHIDTRNKWMQRQKNANFRNEYDRIRGEMTRSTVHPHVKEKLKARAHELKNLFSQGNL